MKSDITPRTIFIGFILILILVYLVFWPKQPKVMTAFTTNGQGYVYMVKPYDADGFLIYENGEFLMRFPIKQNIPTASSDVAFDLIYHCESFEGTKKELRVASYKIVNEKILIVGAKSKPIILSDE